MNRYAAFSKLYGDKHTLNITKAINLIHFSWQKDEAQQVQLLLLTALFSRTFYILTLYQIRKPSIVEMTAALIGDCCIFFPEDFCT